MNHEENQLKQLKKDIMRRIYVVWTLRMLTKPIVLKPVILFVLLWQTANLVSVGSVFRNAPALANLSADFSFFRAAFFNTELTIQLLLLAALAMGAWLVKDTLSGFRDFLAVSSHSRSRGSAWEV
jgi:hypothetical protein